MQTKLPIVVKGHLHVNDDLGNVLADRDNAVHPQNVARVIARALANESNYYIHRIAYGNGGTSVDAALQVTFKTPNDGLPPDLQEWRSRLYNETYSEIIDDSNVNIGTDPGSAGPNVGTRPGGGANPSGDPPTVEHVSGPGVRSQELGVISQVVITSVLNPGEPSGQLTSDLDPNPGATGDPVEDTEGTFVFDEIGLYTTGADAADSSGFQQIDLGGDRNSDDDSGLDTDTTYDFNVDVDGGGIQNVSFKTPASGSGPSGEITYGDICEAINTQDVTWGTPPPPQLIGAIISITDVSGGSYPTIVGANTFGFLQVQSTSSGTTSTIATTAGSTNDMLDALEGSGGIPGVLPAVAGTDAGVQNDPVNPTTERERLLTHVIFSPVLKSANRTLTITYTLTVSVARST